MIQHKLQPCLDLVSSFSVKLTDLVIYINPTYLCHLSLSLSLSLSSNLIKMSPFLFWSLLPVLLLVLMFSSHKNIGFLNSGV
ncbi:hypothetical protein HanPSC8_Chr12g0526211 [Helianthus annuus]|nr:hypothetical protein HanPSC8_Chr12g0526211 [Helianthus annuus]